MNPHSILQHASDCKRQVDLRRKPIFLQDVAVTSLPPDMVLISRSTKTILLAELTVPWGDRLVVSHQQKKAKHQDLIDEAIIKGWHANIFPIEVGCISQQRLCVISSKTWPGTKAPEIAVAAETSSRWLWLRRGHCWSPSAGEG